MPPGQLPHPCAPLTYEHYVHPLLLVADSYVLGEAQAGVIMRPQKRLQRRLLTSGTGVPAPTQRERRGLKSQGVSVGQALCLAPHKHELPHLILTQTKKWKRLEENVRDEDTREHVGR